MTCVNLQWLLLYKWHACFLLYYFGAFQDIWLQCAEKINYVARYLAVYAAVALHQSSLSFSQ